MTKTEYRRTFGLTLVTTLLWSTRVPATPTNGTDVVDGGGTWSSNSIFRSFSAVNQATPPGETSNTKIINQAGFLTTFVLAPYLDSDSDGMIDENDRDDDDDGLNDDDELVGTPFDPATPTDPLSADSDNDGARDAQEAAAGSNPRDATSLLHIIAMARADGTVHVTWQARNGYTYELVGAADLETLNASPLIIDTVSAAGGTPPWYRTTAISMRPAETDTTFYYRVRLMP